jgi:preprotein translocase subunit SecB
MKGGVLSENESKAQMDPAEYRKLLKQVELKSIVLDSCSVKTNRDKIAGNMKLDIRNKVDHLLEDENTSAIITIEYDVTATKTTKKDFALKMSCVYRVMLKSESPITEGFMEIFLNVNIHMNTWPYFREFVQSMLNRIGYPPLTLPFFKR